MKNWIINHNRKFFEFIRFGGIKVFPHYERPCDFKASSEFLSLFIQCNCTDYSHDYDSRHPVYAEHDDETGQSRGQAEPFIVVLERRPPTYGENHLKILNGTKMKTQYIK